jgi:hypothetical protein
LPPKAAGLPRESAGADRWQRGAPDHKPFAIRDLPVMAHRRDKPKGNANHVFAGFHMVPHGESVADARSRHPLFGLSDSER